MQGKLEEDQKKNVGDLPDVGSLDGVVVHIKGTREDALDVLKLDLHGRILPEENRRSGEVDALKFLNSVQLTKELDEVSDQLRENGLKIQQLDIEIGHLHTKRKNQFSGLRDHLSGLRDHLTTGALPLLSSDQDQLQVQLDRLEELQGKLTVATTHEEITQEIKNIYKDLDSQQSVQPQQQQKGGKDDQAVISDSFSLPEHQQRASALVKNLAAIRVEVEQKEVARKDHQKKETEWKKKGEGILSKVEETVNNLTIEVKNCRENWENYRKANPHFPMTTTTAGEQSSSDERRINWPELPKEPSVGVRTAEDWAHWKKDLPWKRTTTEIQLNPADLPRPPNPWEPSTREFGDLIQRFADSSIQFFKAALDEIRKEKEFFSHKFEALQITANNGFTEKIQQEERALTATYWQPYGAKVQHGDVSPSTDAEQDALKHAQDLAKKLKAHGEMEADFVQNVVAIPLAFCLPNPYHSQDDTP